MNNQNLKKWIIPNLPYILFVYLFDKAAQAVRLAPGADLSGKLLGIGNGFTSAFASPLPSFSPVDMLIGIAGAILIRLIVYTKGKNAKKYRKGVEYGSARWGNAEDIKPYIDPPDVKIGTTIFSKKAKNKPHKVSHWVKTIGKPYAAYSYLF